jgi:O-antigen/teichoic acid export membrane protein
MKINMMSNSIYSAISGLLLISGNFISGVIVANFLGLADTGEFYFFIAISLLLATVLDGGASSSVVRFQATLHGQSDASTAHALVGVLARRVFAYMAMGLALVLVLTTFAWPYLSAETTLAANVPPGTVDPSFLLPFGASVAVQTMAMFGISYLRGLRSFRLLSGLSLVSMVAQLTLVWSSVHAIGVMGAIVGYGLGQFALAIVTLGLLFRRGEVQQALRLEVRRYQRFAWAANLCNIFVWSRIEIFLLQYFWTSREVGLFSVALALSALASQGPMLMTGAFLPFLSERHGKGDVAGLQRAFSGGTRLLATVAFPACMGMVAIVPVMVELIYGHQFAPAVPASMTVCAAAAISITAVIGTHMVSALARSDFIFYTALGGAFLSLALGLSIIPAFGVLGAAVARSITQLMMIGAGLWFVTAKLRFAYPFAELARIFLATLPATAIAYIAVELVGGVIGLFAAVALFVPAYLAGLRIFSALPASDLDLLHGFSRKLPRLPARLVHHLLLAIGPARTAQRNFNPAE